MKSNLALQTARDFVAVCILLIVAVRGRCLGVVAVGEYLSFCKASVIQADVAVAACHMPIQQIAAECVGVHIVQVMRETGGAVESNIACAHPTALAACRDLVPALLRA